MSKTVNQFSIISTGFHYLGTPLARCVCVWGGYPAGGYPAGGYLCGGYPAGGPSTGGALPRGYPAKGVPCRGGTLPGEVPCWGGTLLGGYPATLPWGGSYLSGVQAATELFCCELALYSLMPHGIMGNVAKDHGSKKKKKKLWDGYPPVDRQIDGWMDGQTRVKTLPSRRTTYAGGNNRYSIQINRFPQGDF